MPERIIFPASFEKPEEKKAEEKKEELKSEEYLNKSAEELKKIIEALEKDSSERPRLEHVLKSVESSFTQLGKDGAPEGKYRVNILDYEGKQAFWPNGEAAVQDEGVPVDELIKILKGRAGEINEKLPTAEDLKNMKAERDELWRKYDLTDSPGKNVEKRKLYSEWEKAKKALEDAEKARDLGYFEKAKELDGLADELFKRSESYFKIHYDHELPLSEDESAKQNLRTRHEAYLISNDYRKTGNQDEDYQKAMEAMKERKELILKEEEPPPPPGIKKPERLTLVNAEAQLELMSRERASKRLTEMLNHQSRLKRWWYRAWEQGYRQQLIEEERKKILGKANTPGWLKRKLFGVKKFETAGKKNIFAGTGKEAKHQIELSALVERFNKDYIKKSEGEQKKQLEDKEFSQQINDLVFNYASGGMSELDFETEKEKIISDIAEKYPNSFAAGELTADNFLEAAKDFRKIHEHGQGLARLDVNLAVDLGLAKQAIKTKANLNWVDKLIGKIQKYPVIGHVATPSAVGFGVSLGGYFAKKPAYWLGGAAGAGALMGAMRKNMEQKRDLEMHRVERAMGKEMADYGPSAKRREEMEKFVYEMKKAQDVSEQLQNLSAAFEKDPNETNADALTVLLAETEARMSLSETRQKDLISFEGETCLERGRLYLLKEMAEAKVNLQKKGFSSDIPDSEKYKEFLSDLGEGMDKIDKSERWKRWKENVKAGAVGAVTGLVAGGLIQQGAAEIGDRISWLSWLRPGNKATGLERLYRYIKGDVPTMPSGENLQEVLGLSSGRTTIKMDSSIELVPNKTTGFYDLIDAKDHTTILAQANIDSVAGKLALIEGSYNPDLIHLRETVGPGGGYKNISEWLNQQKANLPEGSQLETIHTAGFYDNNTLAPEFDFNEQRFYMNFNKQGDLVMDGSKIMEYMEDLGRQTAGSKHGRRVLEVIESFKNGNIKIAVAPDPEYPGQAIIFNLNPDTNQFETSGKNEMIGALFGKDVGDKAVFKGKGFMGMVEQSGVRPDGSKNVWWVNSIRGNGEDIAKPERYIDEISREIEREWWMPWGPGWFPRKALEKQIEKKDRVIQGGREEPKYTIEDIRDTEEDVKKKLAGKKIKKAFYDTRGQKIIGDRKDYGKDYPESYKFKNNEEMAEYLVDNSASGKVYFLGSDLAEIRGLSRKEQIEFLGQIIKERKIDFLGNERFSDLKQITEFVLSKVDDELKLYGEKGRAEMPDIRKIHFLNLYEYQAQAGLSNMPRGGTFFSTNGETFINFDALNNFAEGEQNKLVMEIKHVLAHEIVHAASANNYWAYQVEGKDEEVFLGRRTGLKTLRWANRVGGKNLIVERGRALNEAVTEQISRNILDKIYGQEGAKPANPFESYQFERNVMRLLQEKYGIPFDMLAKGAIDRKALRDLAERLDGKVIADEQGQRNRERPKFMSLLLSIMDYEFNAQEFGYQKTIQFIQGEKGLQITPEMKKMFPSSLLDENGNIKEELVKVYRLRDLEEESRNPIS